MNMMSYSRQNIAPKIIYSESNLKDIVKEANEFIEEYTGGHIKNAVNEGKIKDKAVNVTNSVYFYSKWSHKLADADNILFRNSKNNRKIKLGRIEFLRVWQCQTLFLNDCAKV